ncbi:MAG TPA: molybdopterin cofactor-binding domain-containing protein, partial [Burkholderiaceae bacterium]
MKRRTLLLSAAGAAGALFVGWSLLPARSRLGLAEVSEAGADAVALNGWITIATDGTVLLAMPRSEMGQGVLTALPMLVAEELDVPLAQVRAVQA